MYDLKTFLNTDRKQKKKDHEPCSTNAVDAETNSSSGLANHGTVLQSLINTLDRVIFHSDEEAWAQLGVWCTGIEEGGRSVREITFRHEIVRLNNPVHVRAVDSDGDPHDHVLRSFSDASIDAKEIGAFESFEPETRK